MRAAQARYALPGYAGETPAANRRRMVERLKEPFAVPFVPTNQTVWCRQEWQ